jgi:hypothetical protein
MLTSNKQPTEGKEAELLEEVACLLIEVQMTGRSGKFLGRPGLISILKLNADTVFFHSIRKRRKRKQERWKIEASKCRYNRR